MTFDRLRDAPKAKPKTANDTTQSEGDKGATEVVSEDKTTTNDCDETIETEKSPEGWLLGCYTTQLVFCGRFQILHCFWLFIIFLIEERKKAVLVRLLLKWMSS